jgi:branched-subunit amino acid transport protein
VSATWVAILLSGVGTYAMRASFVAFADRLTELPPPVLRVLRQIPPAALASIVVPAMIRPHGAIDLWQPRLAAGLVAWRTRNVAVTLVVGIGALMLIDAL